MADDLMDKISRLLFYEAECLDRHRWEEWLSLMDESVEYWVPAWHEDSVLTNDPKVELSLMYYDSRQGLEDRVFRIRSGRSIASSPLPRTCHFVTNIILQKKEGEICHVTANWQTLIWRNGEIKTYFGFYDYILKSAEEGFDWKIQRKKIIVLNSLIENVLDIYLI